MSNPSFNVQATQVTPKTYKSRTSGASPQELVALRSDLQDKSRLEALTDEELSCLDEITEKLIKDSADIAESYHQVVE